MKKLLSVLTIFALILSTVIFSAAADTIGIASDELPTTGWTFEASSTNANNGVPTEVPENVIDGTAEKHWH